MQHGLRWVALTDTHHKKERHMASENVVTLSDANFAETIAAEGAPVLVDFWAEWCGPCKAIAPILDEIADEHTGSVTIAKLNVDDAPNTAREFEVMSIPTMIVFKNGEQVAKMIGAKSKDAIVDELANHM